ncbi:hypothetical protein TCAL_08014 [Tigriopus californicus]|uniref:Uncharacterized protein n=1 Tax=Tigriopus californicus TaxID=6832 RepID=A0A553PIF7_TIGCA|nr:hypothetical protein TCAL_08014 [Tigriopus californicus]|eukprot:TCALIF_08014-PA protein Name:"Protein of unknown function" AED:0.32 eAED:0.92 QI:5/0/0/1/0/0/2/0/410
MDSSTSTSRLDGDERHQVQSNKNSSGKIRTTASRPRMEHYQLHWKKNYRDINQLPYYAYLYQKDPEDFIDPLLPPVSVPPLSPVPPILPPTTSSIDFMRTLRGKSCDNMSSFAFDDLGTSFAKDIPPSSSTSTSRKFNMSRSHSVRAGSGNGAGHHIKLSNLVMAAHQKSKTLSRTGTEPALWGPSGKLSAGCGNPRSSSNFVPGSPSSGGRCRPARMMPPKRAASDVHVRFNNCKLDLMRRIQTGPELPEEGNGTSFCSPSVHAEGNHEPFESPKTSRLPSQPRTLSKLVTTSSLNSFKRYSDPGAGHDENEPTDLELESEPETRLKAISPVPPMSNQVKQQDSPSGCSKSFAIELGPLNARSKRKLTDMSSFHSPAVEDPLPLQTWIHHSAGSGNQPTSTSSKKATVV